MAMTINKAHIPINFELTDTTDNRFRKVKIWIAHTGENLNNTYFTKELLEEMAETLPFIPIVGYLEKNTEDDTDFSDHRQQIVLKNGGVDIEYAGHAYGFIPEDNNHSFEYKAGKEWLTCEGYLWTKFKSAMDTFTDANGIKSQSMEIQDVNGEVDDIGRMVFSKGRFSALCILGDHVPAAMTGSTVEFYSEKDKYKLEIDQMMVEFSKQEGESGLPTLEDTVDVVEDFAAKKKDEKAKEPKDTKDTTEAKDGAATKEVKDPKATKEVKDKKDTKKFEEPKDPKDVKDTKEVKDEEGDVVDPKDDKAKDKKTAAVKKDDKKKNFSIVDTEDGVTVNFELSHSDVRSGLTSAIRSLHTENVSVWTMEVYDNHVVYELHNYETGLTNFMDVAYKKENDVITLGEAHEVVGMFVTKEEAAKIESNRGEVIKLKEELASLTEFKLATELTSKEAIVNEFSESLGSEEVEAITANFSKLSIEDVEKEVAVKLFQKTKAKTKSEAANVTRATNFSAQNTNGRYGALDAYFQNN